MTARVTDRDMGYTALLAGIGKLSSEPAVFVGVRQGVAAEDGTSMVLIASANEFGTSDGHIPERSFIRSTVDGRREAYQAELSRVIVDAITGKSLPAKGLGRLGIRAVADIQRTITTLREPPNAPSTIAAKGSSKPLIDTGRLRQSIEYEVKPVGGPRGGG